MMKIVLEEAKKTSVFHLALGLYFCVTIQCMAHFQKVSASMDYILLCILVFDRAAPLLSALSHITLHSLTVARAQPVGHLFQKQSVGLSVKNVLAINSRKEKITTLILTIIIPQLQILIDLQQLGSNFGL